ncbi:MAG: hypothetical protein RLZZ156_975 [Deinococcota bacterium]|jgi:hypothetical protein
MNTDFRAIYDRFTQLLDIIAEFVPTADTERYVELSRETDGLVVELGIGQGRVAKSVKPTYGVDLSPVMLQQCAERLGSSCPKLIQSDFRDYTLSSPAMLTYLPQSTINNLDKVARIQTFNNVFQNTAPGGRFAFDSIIPNVEDFIKRSRFSLLRGINEKLVLYELLSIQNLDAQEMIVRFHVDFLDEDGNVTHRKFYPALPFNFVHPFQFEELAKETGWEVESLWGGFNKELLTGRNDYQFWVLRKPD